MLRISRHGKDQHSRPDHRPMLPEFRTPADLVEEKVRDNRHRWMENKPDTYMNWR